MDGHSYGNLFNGLEKLFMVFLISVALVLIFIITLAVVRPSMRTDALNNIFDNYEKCLDQDELSPWHCALSKDHELITLQTKWWW